MAWTRAAVLLVLAGAVALVLVSGGSDTDPRTPPALAGMPPPFLGTAVAGSGGVTAAVDAYGDVVDLRASPAGPALIDNPAGRQTAGTVPADTGIVPQLSLGGAPGRPLWRADSVAQRYLPGTNVARTTARFGGTRVVVTAAATMATLAETVVVRGPVGTQALPSFGVDLIGGTGAQCERAGAVGARRTAIVCSTDGSPLDEGSSPVSTQAEKIIRKAAEADRAWLSRARPLGSVAPTWARRMYARSLLTLRALSDRRTGAVAAGARDGWAYVWPRDAGTAALALADSGYGAEARRVARFLLDLDLDAGARFDGDGSPVPGRAPQGDAAGWVAVATRAAGLPVSGPPLAWRHRADYQEGAAGEYLGNAIASVGAAGSGGARQRPGAGSTAGDEGAAEASSRRDAAIAAEFGTPRGLVRRAGDPSSGLDSAAAWAVRPFSQPALFPAVRRTLLALAVDETPYGITPGEGWTGGVDPWTAPTAWTAWSLAALADSERAPQAARADRRQALRLLGDLRRAATPAGSIPERVDAATGVPRSTTPLAWSHAFAILALHQLWPSL